MARLIFLSLLLTCKPILAQQNSSWLPSSIGLSFERGYDEYFNNPDIYQIIFKTADPTAFDGIDYR